MFDLTPGVSIGRAFVRSSNEAAALAVALAEEAAQNGSFGVGGFLVDRTGRVIAEATNSVVRDGHVFDCTAHVERQLVDWHWDARRRGLSVDPSELTIVSSVDPCAMCAGAILRSGMHVVSVAEDQASGVHHDGLPRRMPKALWNLATEHMALFGVRGRRASSENSAFTSEVHPDLLDRAERAFVNSVDPINRLIAERDTGSSCRHFSATESIRLSLRQSLAEVDAVISPVALNLHEPSHRIEIARLLAHDGSALIDELGNIIISVGKNIDTAARTSVMKLLRAYTFIRSVARERQDVALPHQRYCSVVKQSAHADPAKALLELGALGSFLAAPRKSKLLPAFCYQEKGALAEARQLVESLPPLYTSVIGIDVGLIPD